MVPEQAPSKEEIIDSNTTAGVDRQMEGLVIDLHVAETSRARSIPKNLVVDEAQRSPPATTEHHCQARSLASDSRTAGETGSMLC